MKVTTLRSYSLSIAAALIALPGYRLLQAQDAPQPSTLYSAEAVLTHSLNSTNAKVGEAVTAKLTDNVKTAGSIELPKGTVLLGKVEQVQKGSSTGGSTLSLVFDRAQISKGREIPIKATLLGAYPPPVYNDDAGSEGADSSMTTQPSTISSGRTVDQEAGTLNDVSLTSAVKNAESGTFASMDHSIKLQSGTRLQVAVAPMSSTAAATSSVTAGDMQ